MRNDSKERIYGPYQHRGLWRLHVVRTSGGGRKTFYRSYTTRDRAEAALAGAQGQAQGVTVKSATDALLAAMRENGLGDGTITTAEFRLWHFFQLARYGDKPIRWLNKRGEELYAAARKDRKPDTHHAELALAKQVGALAIKKRWLRENPFEHVETIGRKTHGSSKPRLTIDESRALREHCLDRDDDQHALITLAYLLLGSRASELVRRSVRDLDDDGRLLWINRAKTTTGVRRLKLPDELRLPLLALLKGRSPGDPIFVREDGKRATRHWAYHHVKRICREAKVTELTPQGLRRTQSDVATDAGVSAIEVARHLGQKSERVTNRSYRDRTVTADAKAAQAMRVIAGGRK